MTTFVNIFNEADQILKMTEEFSAKYLNNVEPKQIAPNTAIPAIEPSQGEQKIPVVKPNGVTR